MESALRKWIGSVGRPVGFILLGVMIGAGLTLVIQGRVATSDIVLGVVYLLAFAVILVNMRKNKAFFIPCSVCGARFSRLQPGRTIGARSTLFSGDFSHWSMPVQPGKSTSSKRKYTLTRGVSIARRGACWR